MRLYRPVLLLMAVLVLAPALALAAAQSGAAKAQTKAKATAAATHATSGIVKTIDATSLVISRGAKTSQTLSFVVNAATVKKGDLVVGTHVEVRYRADGGQNIATAITAAVPKRRSSPTS